MPPRSKKQAGTQPLGIEATLWKAADALRGSMDSANYKHVVLGLVFLKYISDSFTQRREALAEELAADGILGDDAQPLLESRDEYASAGVFWVPEAARWAGTPQRPGLRETAKLPGLGARIDAAMEAIEADNPSLRGVLPKNYAAANVDARRLGELVDLISGVGLHSPEGGDILGRVYEYFLGQFAASEGKKSGEFYTPRSIVRLLVEMLQPYSGRVYDPCAGSAGMFVQAEEFVLAHGGQRNDISVYGQELNDTTWRLAKMNLAIRGIEADLGPKWADTFHEDLHPDLRARYTLFNPPFNVSSWGGDQLRDDPRWVYGTPPTGNANFAWVQHALSKLDAHGQAGIVLANGSLSSQQSGEGDIRRRLVEADVVECIVALPGQLFYGTGIPVSLWFLNKDKSGHNGTRDRRGEILFIDARDLGHMVGRVHRDLSDEDIARVSRAFHSWQGHSGASAFMEEAGFCCSASLASVIEHRGILTPARYVGRSGSEDGVDAVDDATLAQLTQDVVTAFEASHLMQNRVLAALERLHG